MAKVQLPESIPSVQAEVAEEKLNLEPLEKLELSQPVGVLILELLAEVRLLGQLLNSYHCFWQPLFDQTTEERDLPSLPLLTVFGQMEYRPAVVPTALAESPLASLKLLKGSLLEERLQFGKHFHEVSPMQFGKALAVLDEIAAQGS